MHLLHRGRVGPARVGFVVSKAVGNAVIRNRVKRRLRHLMRDARRLALAAGRGARGPRPAGAAAASYAELGAISTVASPGVAVTTEAGAP